MLVFIDESGDSGMKFKEGSSEYFTICAVLFLENRHAQLCNQRIDELRDELGYGDRWEFHFNKCSRDIRERFLRGVSGQSFQYSAFILNKKKAIGAGFQHKKTFYKYPVKLACENLADQLRDAVIVLDRCGEREFMKEVDRYLRRALNKKHPGSIKKVKSDRSHNNNLVQLADMVCGAVARSYRAGKKDRHLYRTIIRAKETRVQLWPK